jgi:hypothetical protein
MSRRLIEMARDCDILEVARGYTTLKHVAAGGAATASAPPNPGGRSAKGRASAGGVVTG